MFPASSRPLALAYVCRERESAVERVREATTTVAGDNSNNLVSDKMRSRAGRCSAAMACELTNVASRPGSRRSLGILSPPAPRGYVAEPGQLPSGRRQRAKAGNLPAAAFFLPPSHIRRRKPALSPIAVDKHQ